MNNRYSVRRYLSVRYLALISLTGAMVLLAVGYQSEHRRAEQAEAQRANALAMNAQMVKDAQLVQAKLESAELRAHLWQDAYHIWTKDGISAKPDDPDQKLQVFKIGSTSPANIRQVEHAISPNGCAGFPWATVNLKGEIFTMNRLGIAMMQATILEDAEKRGYSIHVIESGECAKDNPHDSSN